MKKIIKNIFKRIEGKKKFQRFFETLYRFSLAGMNYGNGGNFNESGELQVIEYLKEKFASEGSIIIFDVGSNAGNYSLILSELVGSKAIIHSFEPSAKTYKLFLETTKNKENIVPNNFGFGDTDQYQILYSNKEGSGLASMYQRNLEHFGITMDQSERVQLFTIDAYCKENNIDRIHFLKIDIEGHELKALSGAKEMISENKIEVIQFEFGGCNIDSRTYFQDFYYLLKDKYRIYRILKDGLFEIPAYKETYEVFITINYLAVRK